MIVTISRDYGAAAAEVAHELSDLLGYRVAGEDFPQVVEARLGATALNPDVEGLTRRTPRLIEWMLERLLGPVGSISVSQTFEDQVRHEIEAAVNDAAAYGDVIILGGVSNAVLRGRTDMLSAYLHAPLAYRIARLHATLGLVAEEARETIRRTDDAKRQWARMHYQFEFGDASQYDLALDVARLGIPGVARLIAAAVRELAPV